MADDCLFKSHEVLYLESWKKETLMRSYEDFNMQSELHSSRPRHSRASFNTTPNCVSNPKIAVHNTVFCMRLQKYNRFCYLRLPCLACCCTPWTRGKTLVRPRASAALLTQLQLLCCRGLQTTWCLYSHWRIYKKRRKAFISMVTVTPGFHPQT